MALTLEQIVEKIKTRKKSGRVGTAFDYLSGVKDCVGDRRMERFLNMGNVSDWEKALTASQNQLIFRDDALVVYGGRVKNGNDAITTFGSPKRKEDDEGSKPAAKILMTLEYIATSRKRDRDGDILEPQGARVDVKMPFLWQHIPMEPIGGFIAEVERTEEYLKLSSYIADTMLGNDAAVLVELGALRISHGFKPNKWEPIDDESYGWHVTDFDMLETSLVSIPANPDAEITAFSKQKLHHPLVKEWAGRLYRERAPIVKSGWDGGVPTIIVNVNTEGKSMTAEEKAAKEAADKVAADKAAADKAAADKATKEKADKDAADKAAKEAADKKAAKKKKKKKKSGFKFKTPLKLVHRKADDEEDDDEEDDDEEASKEDDDEEDEDEEDGEQAAMLTQLEEFITSAAATGDMPKEAVNRLGVLTGMLEDVRGYTESFVSEVGECGASLDVAGILSCFTGFLDNVADTLVRMTGEVDAVLSVRNLPDGCGEPLGNARSLLETITTALSAVSGKDDPVDANDDGLEDDEERDVPIGSGEEEEAGKTLDALLGKLARRGKMSLLDKKRLRLKLAKKRKAKRRV